MGLFGWRRALPARLRPPLEREERLLAWAGLADGTVLVATNRGLWIPEASAALRRLGWHEIHKVVWSGRQLTVTPAEEVPLAEGETPPTGYLVVADAPTVTYPLTDPDRVPDQVRTRVDRSVAYTRHHPLPGGGGVRVVARRVGGVDGLHWTVRYDTGTDPAEPGVAATTAELVERAKIERAG